MIRCDIPFIKTNAMNRRRRQLTDDNTTTNNIYNGINDPHAQRMRPRLQPAKFRFSPQASRKVSPYDDIRNRYVSPYDSLHMTRSDPVRFCAIPVCPCLPYFRLHSPYIPFAWLAYCSTAAKFVIDGTGGS
jgi:hypothetical protein